MQHEKWGIRIEDQITGWDYKVKIKEGKVKEVKRKSNEGKVVKLLAEDSATAGQEMREAGESDVGFTPTQLRLLQGRNREDLTTVVEQGPQN